MGHIPTLKMGLLQYKMGIGFWLLTYTVQVLEKYNHYIHCNEFLKYQIDDSDEWNNNSDKLLQIDPKKNFCRECKHIILFTYWSLN